MTGLNEVLLMGNMTRDPDVRYTREGRAVCTFGLALHRWFRTREGEDHEETCFVDVEAFGPLAETCGRYGRKGRAVLVEGRLRLKRWEDRRSGREHSKLLVTGESLQFLDHR